MGCDIHLHIEVKVAGKWEHWGNPNIRRSYRLFGAMAGVRDEEEIPIVAPKGFPSDASLLTRMDYEHEGLDAHTPSWLDHKEIIALEKRLNQWRKEEVERNPSFWGLDLEHHILHSYLFGNSFTAKWKHDDIDYAPGVDDVRFVFWFDN